jgi:hypothetical protein
MLNLKHLKFRVSDNVTDVQMQSVSPLFETFSHLTHLDFWCRVSDAHALDSGVKVLTQKNPGLQYVSLVVEEMTDQSLVALSKLTDVRQVSVTTTTGSVTSFGVMSLMKGCSRCELTSLRVSQKTPYPRTGWGLLRCFKEANKIESETRRPFDFYASF